MCRKYALLNASYTPFGEEQTPRTVKHNGRLIGSNAIIVSLKARLQSTGRKSKVSSALGKFLDSVIVSPWELSYFIV